MNIRALLSGSVAMVLALPVLAVDVVYDYDNLNRLKEVNYGNGQQIIQYSYDPAGNILAKTITVADQLPPLLTVTSPADGTVVPSDTVTISGTATDSGRGDTGITSVTVNGQSAPGGTASGSGMANWSLAVSLSYGINNLSVIATDGSPFANQALVSLTVTYQPPFTDTDGDGLDDAWEQYYFNNLSTANATTDSDNDGQSDLTEYQNNSNPNNPLSRSVNLQFVLKPGFQPLGYPLTTPAVYSAFGFLTQLQNTGAAVSAIQAIPFNDGVFHSAQIDLAGGGLSGEDFPLLSGQGVLATVASPGTLVLNGPVHCETNNLFAGLNVVAFSCLKPGYTAFQLLTAIGGDTVVSTVQRFDPISGLFESAVYENGVPTGTDFPISVGEAYLIHMQTDVFGFDVLQ